ncbi:Type 1 glutamine amidotransferase-like domain-containing protein [Patescibacteria group bacterium]|nr:Type 1 glutamine amidotransferase-like domain-containing protein [Patescibacteria group bacterium]
MTKYIINSGGLRNNPDKHKKYLAEIVKDLGNKPKILLCFWAQKREDWEISFAEKSESLAQLMPKGIKATFEMATPDQFEKQVANNQAIIIHGGDDTLVKYWLSKFDLKNLFVGKVVAGSSAGADVLVKHFWTCDWRQCMDGLGILPIRFIPHYKSDYGIDDPRGPVDWDKAYQELESYGDKNLPIHALQEGEFIVIEK